MTDTTTDQAAELEAITARQAAAREATARARAELAAAKAARATAVVDDTLTAQHVERLDDAREELELCEDVESELARRRRVLVSEVPAPVVDGIGDNRTVRVRVTGIPGRHSCNQPSTGRPLFGGQDVELPADDAVALAQGGHVYVTEQPVPGWWPRTVPVIDDATLGALSVR